MPARGGLRASHLSGPRPASRCAWSSLNGDVGLGRDAAFVGVLLAVQGVGAIAGAAVAAALVRRAGELPVAGLLLLEAAVVAGAGAWLLTRAARGVAASH